MNQSSLGTVFLILLMSVSAFAQAGGPATSDVVIYGATPAGIAAALAAADGQRSVLLIEPTSRIGGMTTHGLSHSDFHSFEALHGPFLHFSQRVLKHYESTYGKDSEQVRDCWRGTHGEPSVNLLVFQQMLAEKPSIRILTEHRIARVSVEDHSITTLIFSNSGGGSVAITPGIVIDASYEGDLLAAAGVPYRVGREARSEYGESLAPEEADDQIQGYNFRLCMTQEPKNRVPVPVPVNYDREDYAALVPLVKADKFRSAFGYPGSPFVLKAHLPALPNGKRDINDVSKGLVRLSLPGRNRGYPEGDVATRLRIEQEHLDWQLGLIHFVQTDPALPEAFRKEAATWGLCRDEFAVTNHIPPQIYVREARRMVGLRVYIEADTEYAANDARSRLHPDSIAVGEYSHNCHGTAHEGPQIGGRHTGEFYKGVAPYQIPYGVIVPKKMRNLLVPTACSASHVGFCAIRLEPIWMSLGGAAGHAANMALEANLPVQQVDVGALQKRISSQDGAAIHVSDVPPGHPDFAAVQWWAGLGGLHGVEPAPAKPGTRGQHIVSQYFEAFPGHAAKLDQPLDNDLRKRWTALAKELRLFVPAESTTRGDWIREVFGNTRFALEAAENTPGKLTRISHRTGEDDFALQLLGVSDVQVEILNAGKKAGLLEWAPVNLPINPPGDCNHYGWPVATMSGDTIVVMHRRIPGHRAKGAGKPHPKMSYGVVLRSDDGGKTWSEPYDLRDCMKPEDRNRGGVVPLSHRAKFDKGNKSPLGYKVHLHAIGTACDGAVIAVNNHGVFRSDDAGRTWKHFSEALREDTFKHAIINIGPHILDDPRHGLLVFGNWFGEVDQYHKYSEKLVVLRSPDGGATWRAEEHPAGFKQYEPAAIFHDGRYHIVTRDQNQVRAHRQMTWLPGQEPTITKTNLQDPRLVDTVDLSFNPVTMRFEIVRSERHRMELWLWSIAPEAWSQGEWRRECRLFQRQGKFYANADGFHPAGAVIDEKRGVQHIFIYSGHPNGPAGVFRLTRTLDTPKLVTFLRKDQ